MGAFVDFLQGANNAAASTVTGPVDGLAWLLRKARVPVGDAPAGGSAWAEQAGLTRPAHGAAGLLGEALGLSAPIVVAAKAPQIARGLLQAGTNAMAPRVLNQQSGVLNMSPRSAEQIDNASAMQQVGYERGWWRGGPRIEDGRKSGDWYTRSAQEAADYARRFGDLGEVREYALPAQRVLRADRSYDSRLAHDLAAQVDSFGEKGEKLAQLLRNYGPNDRPSGVEIWRGLDKWLGDGAATQSLSKLGFKAVSGVNGPDYMRVFPDTMVRDAQRAKFDPSRMAENNIFAADLRALAAAGGLGSLAAALSRSPEPE